MSTRQLLNLTMGAFALLFLAALGIVFSTIGSQADEDSRIDLAVSQQVLIQDLSRQTSVLAAAEDRESVAAARDNMARTIVEFDRNLAVLLHGGEFIDEAGQVVSIGRTGSDSARRTLEAGAELWRQTGRPLADLAAGEFSVFSAAGQIAVNGLQTNNIELMQNMGAAANALRIGQHTRATVTRASGWASAGLAVVLISLGFFRRRLLTAGTPAVAEKSQEGNATPAPAAAKAEAKKPFAPSARPVDPVSGTGNFSAPMNFDTVSASVDQMSVDMNTIAGSTEKMRQAIDSVGHALQGMLYSLNEMAQDTAEGHKIVRNANNAASFTATTAGDLATSAREMAAVVARVTQLARKTKQVAAQIDGEAVQTGKTGETFTSVVAGEVYGLSQQTNQATQEIEGTVSEILATARQYEEAIGQIIKNVSAINKVSENLGELMLSPPPRVEPALAPAAAPALTVPPVSEPAVQAAAPEDVSVEPEMPTIPDDPVEPDSTPEEMAAETAEAIVEVADEPASTTIPAPEAAAEESEDDSVFLMGSRTRSPDTLNIPDIGAADADEVVEQVVAPVDGETDKVAAATEAEAPVEENTTVEESDLGVFMLNKSEDDSEPAPAPGPAEAGEGLSIGEESPEAEPAPQTVPESDEPALGEEGSNANIFMLNKPK